MSAADRRRREYERVVRDVLRGRLKVGRLALTQETQVRALTPESAVTTADPAPSRLPEEQQ